MAKLKDTTKILFRKLDTSYKTEYDICSSIFLTTDRRTKLHNTNVIGRYSILPYYKEVYYDLEHSNCRLLASPLQHYYIASFDWYWWNEKLRNFTPKTWNDMSVQELPDIPLVVKGCTNSKKNQWKELMFAEDKQRAIEIACELRNDMFIGEQSIIYREYIPLKTWDIGIGGLPFTNEWRFFYWKDKMLANGYYWTQLDNPGCIPFEAVKFATNIARILKEDENFPDFICFDVAEKESGGWMLVEINDAQMSGLSYCDAEELYTNLGNIEYEE